MLREVLATSMGTLTVATTTRAGPSTAEATVRQLSSINRLGELDKRLRVDRELTVIPSPRSDTEQPGGAETASGKAEAPSDKICREPCGHFCLPS